ncbi:MAG: hypothetical protein ACRC0A_06195, partial [Chitinophagaceae bacterium]
MKNIKTNFILIIIIVSLGCIKQIDLQVPFANQGIAISGGFFHYLNNPDTTQYITLTKTIPYTQSEILPENYIKNAIVKVGNDKDTFEFTYNNTANAYTCKPEKSIGFNKKYTLYIEYEGNTYVGSDSMLPPVKIDSFYMAHTTDLFGQPSNPPKYVPKIAYSLSNQRENFYYWGCRYSKFFDGHLDKISFNPNKNNNFLVIRDESSVVAQTKHSLNIAKSFDPAKLKDTILYFTASQYHISKQTYEYQNILGIILGNMGPVATPSPPNIQSNIACTTNKDKRVFGYFMA